MKNKIKCRYCDWTTLAWGTKNGKRRSGWPRLLAHIEQNHPEQYKEIQERLEVEYNPSLFDVVSSSEI